MANKFNNSKIYKLTFNGEPDVYIGSTTTDLKKRLYGHLSNGNIYVKRLVEKVGKSNVNIHLLENYMCYFKGDLIQREQYWITKEKACLNIKNAYTSEDDQKIKRAEWVKLRKLTVSEFQSIRKEYDSLDDDKKILYDGCNDYVNKKYLKLCGCGNHYLNKPFYIQYHNSLQKHKSYIQNQ